MEHCTSLAPTQPEQVSTVGRDSDKQTRRRVRCVRFGAMLLADKLDLTNRLKLSMLQVRAHPSPIRASACGRSASS